MSVGLNTGSRAKKGGASIKMSEKVYKMPILNEDGGNYESWKKDIDIWCLCQTSMTVKKQAFAIHLSLTGKARIATSELDLTHVPDAEAVNRIKEKLDSLFLPEQHIRQFICFSKMFNLRRKEEDSISNYIHEFEHNIFRFNQEGMNMPDGMMAFFLLALCQLSESDSRLVLSNVQEVTYAKMRAALLRIFGHSFSATTPMQTLESKSVDVKSEPVYCAGGAAVGDDETYFVRRGSGRGYSSGRSRGTSNRGSWRGSSGRGNRGSSRRQNPLDAEGKVTTCAVCSSTMHWARECPHSYENSKGSADDIRGDDTGKMNFSGFVGCNTDGESSLVSFVQELNGCALLDSGCANTVCGEDWLSNLLSNLSDLDRALVRESPSDQPFTFGNGKTFRSGRKITFPCYISGLKGEITTDVIECKIPLLLSLKSMKRMGMILDFKKDLLTFCGKQVKLGQVKSGHYSLPLSL